MRSSTFLFSALAAATTVLASPYPAATPTTNAAASPAMPAVTTSATGSEWDSSASPAQASAIKALIAESPEGIDAPNGTFIEIMVTHDNQMYIRYQHAHPLYREFNTTDGKKVPATGYGDGDDYGQAMLMEAIYGGKEGSLGDSMAKAWSLYKSYYGYLPTGVPSQVLSETATSATSVATKV